MTEAKHPSSMLIRNVGTPALFVLLWSTGFIGARLGLPDAGPLTFLTLRYALAAALLALLALATRAVWPRRMADVFHLAIAGLMVHGLYLGGVFVGISMGVEAGVSALIVGLQPLLTAALAGLLLGERVTGRQWFGLGVALLGVALVLSGKLCRGAGDTLGSLACVAALLGITAGTLYQKRFCAEMDLRTGGVVQFVASGLATAPLAFWLERMRVDWTGEFVVALVWLVCALSIGAVSLLYLLIRRGSAAQVASLFFLVPPCTAVIAWMLFGETLGPAALVGMVLAATGVALATRTSDVHRRQGEPNELATHS